MTMKDKPHGSITEDLGSNSIKGMNIWLHLSSFFC